MVDEFNAFHATPSSADVESMFATSLSPHIDYPGLARWTLREHWENSSPEQRDAFLDALRKHVIKTYASALSFDKNMRLQLDQDVKTGKRLVQVSGTLQNKDSESTNILFRIVGKEGQWQIFDVGVQGISVAKTLRADIAAVAGKGGIDAATHALTNGNFQLVSR
ncbi:MAG: ABC transporter substrate-binding protein [Pseudomonadota bacterium]